MDGPCVVSCRIIILWTFAELNFWDRKKIWSKNSGWRYVKDVYEIGKILRLRSPSRPWDRYSLLLQSMTLMRITWTMCETCSRICSLHWSSDWRFHVKASIALEHCEKIWTSRDEKEVVVQQRRLRKTVLLDHLCGCRRRRYDQECATEGPDIQVKNNRLWSVERALWVTPWHEHQKEVHLWPVLPRVNGPRCSYVNSSIDYVSLECKQEKK
jgi:hypothetical protein